MAEVLRSSLAVLGLFLLAECLSAPVPVCGEAVVRLQAEVRRLSSALEEQHRYIQQLQTSQTQSLPQIPLSALTQDQYRDCSEVFQDGNALSGVYEVRPDESPALIQVFCDMSDGGGWTVLQRRRDGQESFDRAWVEYKHGFGDLHSPNGEFWLGNDALHYLTSQGKYDLRIDMEDFEGNQRYAEYKNFQVDDEKDQYQLHLGRYSGTAGDALAEAHPPADQQWTGPGLKFSTPDRTNADDGGGCVHHDNSGWWFSRCESGGLNGQYRGPARALSEDGVLWHTWHGWWYSLKSVVMMMRAADRHEAEGGAKGGVAKGGVSNGVAGGVAKGGRA